MATLVPEQTVTELRTQQLDNRVAPLKDFHHAAPVSNGTPASLEDRKCNHTNALGNLIDLEVNDAHDSTA